MTKVILDTSILIAYPAILAVESSEFEFIVPDLVVEKISKFKDNTPSLMSLVSNARNAGTIKIEAAASSNEGVRAGVIVDYVSFQIANFGKYLLEQNQNVIVATENKKLQDFCNLNNIPSKGLSDLLTLIDSSKTVNTEIEIQTKSFSNQQFRRVLLGFFWGTLFALLIVWGYLNVIKIVQTIQIWGTVTATFILGIFLFYFREIQRQIYGVIEFVVGIASVFMLFYPEFDLTKIDINAGLFIKISGGLYIMVRGQDNIYKSLEGKKTRVWIDKYVFRR
jgi:hypothetical protein